MMNQSTRTFEYLLLQFADLFKFPERELFDEIRSGELDRQIKELSTSAGQQILSNFQDTVENYESMVETYNRYLLGVRKPFAPPVESLYKVWTTDESYQGPHKNQKGYLMGDSALHVKHILQALGLEIPKEYEFMPDHLTILLELYAYLIREEMLTEALQFKKDHLDWLGDYYDALYRLAGNTIYSHTILILSKILEAIDSE